MKLNIVVKLTAKILAHIPVKIGGEWYCERPKWCPLKEIKNIKSLLQKCVNKEHHYKCLILEGIAKDEAIQPDIEEAQELIE